jgi:multidrug efflux pump subunit AcrB
MMTFMAAVILGLVAYRSMPVSLMPDIPIPEVTVNAAWPGSPARELENTVVRQLRAQVMQVGHLSDIRSETHDGSATISLRFDYGTDVDYAFIEVNEKIDGAMNTLPRDMPRPRVIKASATDIPVFYLNLTLEEGERDVTGHADESYRFIELSEFAESVIRKRIEQLPEVAMVDISGTLSPQLVIEPDMVKLQNLGLTIEMIEAALADNNINAGTIIIRDGHFRYNIRITSVLRGKEDVENILMEAGGRIFRLNELATVTTVPQKRDGMFASNGRPAITMAVIKQSNARLADMREKIDALVEQFSREYPGMRFEASQDQTQLLHYSIVNLKQNLLQGLLLVILVVFLFMRDLKLPLLIGLSLMVSVVISLLFFTLMGLSINIISLAGLILAVGNMMDNSIVVTDNISQYRERGLGVDDACVKGTGEVMIPQLSSMLVNVAVFLPLVFLSGIAGALMYDEALSVIIGLSVSYLVGITFMPVIYRMAYRRTYRFEMALARFRERLFSSSGGKRNKRITLERFYSAGLDFTFRHKTLCITIFLLLIPAGLLVLKEMKREKMPALTQTETIATVEWNENIDVAENSRRVTEVLGTISQYTQQSNAYIGKQQFLLNRDKVLSPSEVRLYIRTISPGDLAQVEQMISQSLSSGYSKASLTLEPPVNIFEKLFTSSEPPLVAELTMKNSALTPDIPALLDLNREMNSDPHLASSNRIPLEEHLVIETDMEKLLLYDVRYEDLVRVIRTGLRENRAGELHSFSQFIPVVISGREATLEDIIDHSSVSSADGTRVPVSALVTLMRSQDLKTIAAGREGEYVPLIFVPVAGGKDEMISQIDDHVSKATLFDVRYSGSVFTNMKLLKEMGLLLLISIMLLYFILAAQFESMVQPLIVLLEIPADIAAALFILYIAGQSLNLMSAMGMVIMTGIIITDSILKVDVFNQLRKEGYSLMDAIREGGHRRLRAIIMTGLTSVLAMLPLLFSNDMGSELQKPFSYALIGGMTMGTMVSLFIVPLVYWSIYSKSEGVVTLTETGKDVQ